MDRFQYSYHHLLGEPKLTYLVGWWIWVDKTWLQTICLCLTTAHTHTPKHPHTHTHAHTCTHAHHAVVFKQASEVQKNKGCGCCVNMTAGDLLPEPLCHTAQFPFRKDTRIQRLEGDSIAWPYKYRSVWVTSTDGRWWYSSLDSQTLGTSPLGLNEGVAKWVIINFNLEETMGCSSAKFLGGSCKVALNQSNHLGMMILRSSFTASAAGCTHACRVQRTPAPFIRNIENTSTAWLSIARISHYHCHNL